MAVIRNHVSIYSNLLSNCSNDRFGLKDVKGRILCVLPFSDYLKLRKVSKKDYVAMEGNVLGFADEYDIVVVKQCKIVEINGKKQ